MELARASHLKQQKEADKTHNGAGLLKTPARLHLLSHYRRQLALYTPRHRCFLERKLEQPAVLSTAKFYTNCSLFKSSVCMCTSMLFSCILQIAPAPSGKPHSSPRKPCPLRESLNKRNTPKKNPSSAFLATVAASIAASCPDPHLSTRLLTILGANPVCGRYIISPHRQPIKYPYFSWGDRGAAPLAWISWDWRTSLEVTWLK